ncbi:ABC transporter permease, partial [Streptomyces niveus]|uniref:ABC transporter permease n=1 Tax=Streptomyces niveus TaxID=193462 RepID=UPI0020D2769E
PAGSPAPPSASGPAPAAARRPPPGAFVGMLLGGASPLFAGAVQLFVLVALMAVQAVAVSVVLELVARGRVHREA